MTTRRLNLCKSCLHNNGDGTCVAFPEGIPDDILLLGDSHLSHVPGDHGVTFALKNNAQSSANFEEWRLANSGG